MLRMKVSKREMNVLIQQQNNLHNLVMENHKILERLEGLLSLILAQSIVSEYELKLQHDAAIRSNLLERLVKNIANIIHAKNHEIQ